MSKNGKRQITVSGTLVDKIRRAAAAHTDPEDQLRAVLDLEPTLDDRERELCEELGMLVLADLASAQHQPPMIAAERSPFARCVRTCTGRCNSMAKKCQRYNTDQTSWSREDWVQINRSRTVPESAVYKNAREALDDDFEEPYVDEDGEHTVEGHLRRIQGRS